MDKQAEVLLLYANVISDLRVLAEKHESSTAYLLLGILNTCAADPSMVATISMFVLGEITAKQRLN